MIKQNEKVTNNPKLKSSVEYHTIAISDITGIHKFLMKKHNIR